MALIIATWLWGSKYPGHYVERLAAGVARNLKQDHRFVVIKPHPDDEHLTRMKGCFARLRLFDPEFQAMHGFAEGDRIACLDLDLIVTGSLDEVFNRDEPFVILQGANTANPCPFNGSVWMLRAGYRPDVWSDFSLIKAEMIPFFEFPDDQGWFWHKMPDAAGWKCGAENGVYAFQKRGWPRGDDLPADARIVAFPGHRDPSQFENLPWVRKHWSR